jgi:uncharacterized protein with ParB-like and HNH nuclease domain
MAIISSITSIVNLFNNSDLKQFIIPMYQRSYRWDTNQINDFTNDLETLLKSTSSDKYHFFGLLVLCETSPNSKKYEIIDGQQRITTISLLIAILRDIVNDLSYHSYFRSVPRIKEELEDLKSKLNTCLTDSGELKLKTLNEAMYESEYLSLVLDKITELPDNYSNKYGNQLDDSKSTFDIKWEALCETPKFNQTSGKAKPIRKNYESLNSKIMYMLSDLDLQEKLSKIKTISKSVLEDFKVIPFIAVHQAEAFALFETLNDRGLDVAAGDLIKNLCLKMGADKEHRKSIFTTWKKIFTENLGDLDGIVFLRYAYNSRYDFIMKSELYKSYSSKISKLTRTELDTFLENLLNDSINYRSVLKDDNGLEIELRNVLRLLKSTNSTQYITLALAIIRCRISNTNSNNQLLTNFKRESNKLLLELHKLILSIMIHGQGMNQIERLIPSLAVKISNHTDLEQATRICVDCREILEGHRISNGLTLNFATLDDLVLDSNLLSLSLINTINFCNLSHSQTLPNNLTLEHVYPQKSRAGEWPEIESLTPDEINNLCLYSIGNHIPSLQSLNSSVSNKNFDDKKEVYLEKSYKDFPFANTELDIYTISKWTPEVINNRKNELNNMLLKYFKS